MTSAEQAGGLTFEAPGPGSYKQDPVHFPRPLTRYWTEIHPGAVRARHGRLRALLRDADRRARDGVRQRLRLQTQLPAPEEEIPQRFARAAEVMAGKLWREQLREWDETCKPTAIAKHRELQAVDPDALSDDELVEYLDRCRDHHAAMITQHMRFTASAVVPTGDFLAHVGDWTGLPPAELLGLMRGASPVSAGASAELERLIAAIARRPGGAGAARVGRRPGRDARGAALARRRDGRGDVRLPRPRRLPAARRLRHLRAVRARAARRAAAGDPDRRRRQARRTSDVEAQIAEIRGKVPEEHRDEFDELLGEARLIYRLRDERGVYSDIWASGIMRRAALAAGRRLAARGPHRRARRTSSTPASTRCARSSRGSGGPSADELAARAAYRADAQRQGRAADARPARRRRRRTRPGCRRPSARLMRATGHRARRAVRQLRGGARGAPAARARGEPRRLRGHGAARSPARPSSTGSSRATSSSRVDDRGVQHPAAAARRDRHRQRRPALALGDRRARVRHPRRRRDARGDGADRGRRARARRRRRGRGDGPRVSERRPARGGRATRRSSARRPSGSARRSGTACRFRPASRSRAPIVEAVAVGRRGGDRSRSPRLVAAARRPARRALVGGRRGRRRRELRRPAPDAAQRAVGRRPGRRAAARSGGRRTPTRRSPTASGSACSRGRASASSSRRCSTPRRAGVMFTQNPVTGADERMIEASWGLGEAVVAGLVIPDSFRIDRAGEVLERTAGPQADRDPRASPAAAPSRRRFRPSWPSSSASTTASSRS